MIQAKHSEALRSILLLIRHPIIIGRVLIFAFQAALKFAKYVYANVAACLIIEQFTGATPKHNQIT